MATRWGIVSSGKIASDFATALKYLPDEHQVVAVAARSLESAQKFADKFGIPKAYGSYEELACDKNIDVAYIGAIHPVHLSLCKMFLTSGHPVLCEKPMTMNAREARQVLDLARKHGVFFMEAFWSRFFPVYKDLRKKLDGGSIGEVRLLVANFGDDVIEKVPRLENKDVGGGGLLDMGCYPIQFAQFVYNHEKPLKIVAAGFLNEKSGVDEQVTATLLYSNNRMATVTCSLKCTLDQCATIYGSTPEGKNVIKLENFWNPENLVLPSGETYSHPLPDVHGTFNFRRSQGLMYEAQAVRDCLKKGLLEHPLMTWDMSLQIQEIMDEIRKQIGLVYPQDQA